MAGSSLQRPDPGLPDLTGHWEKNYGRSDDFNNRFNLFIADVQRGIVNRGGNQGPVIGTNIASRESLLGLARFTEELTRLPQLDISQSDYAVEVERPEDFPLVCLDNSGVQANNAFGTERCGWNRSQLLFQQAIGRDLTISHQFTLGPDGNELSIVTTVRSALVGTPLTVSNYYRRADNMGEEFGCMLTLTRKTVCSRYGQ